MGTPDAALQVHFITMSLSDERVCMDVHDRAIFYYRILRQDASKVFENSLLFLFP